MQQRNLDNLNVPAIRDSEVNVSQPERIGSAVGGGALALYGLSQIVRGKFGSLPLLALGGYLVYRGATGHCYISAALGINTATGEQEQSRDSVISHQSGIRISKSLTIGRPVEELYAYWRNFENLPRIMRHLESVTVQDANGQRSHWVAKAPLGQTVEWDAEIVHEETNERIGWRSLEGAQIPNAGAVIFKQSPGGRGTELRVELQYDPPAGQLGALVAKLFGEEPEQQMDEDLRRFKQFIETGEFAQNDSDYSKGKEQKADFGATNRLSGSSDGGSDGSKAGLPDQAGQEVEQAVVVNRPVAEVYQFWRNFENLPYFMNHLKSVAVQDGNGTRSHWVANAPLGQTVEWDAEITAEQENSYIAWRSLEGAQVPNQGAVRFAPQGDNQTEVRVSLKYAPPAGVLGKIVATIFGEEPSQQIDQDLGRLKQYLETGNAENAGKASDLDRKPQGVAEGKGILVEKSVTVNRPVAELYSYWRNFANLPRIMSHLKSVTVQDGNGTRSHWVANAPLGQTVEWDAEIIAEQENHHIAWRSLEGAQVANEGAVRFSSLGDDQTEVAVLIKYEPPLGQVGATVARLLGEEPNKQLEDDLNNFKAAMEGGNGGFSFNQTSDSFVQ